MIVPTGILVPVTAVFVGATAGDVALSIYDVTTGSAVLIQGLTAMTAITAGAYFGRFTPVAGKEYVAFAAVYTDNTFATINTGYVPVVVPLVPQNPLPQPSALVGTTSCSPSFESSCTSGPQGFSISQGDQKTIYFRIVDENGVPLDLTSCTQILVTLPSADGTFTQLELTMGQVSIQAPEVLGQFSALITSAVSPVLNTGTMQEIDVTLTIAGIIQTVRFQNALSVFEVS
jgi:hypothetical protein